MAIPQLPAISRVCAISNSPEREALFLEGVTP